METTSNINNLDLTWRQERDGVTILRVRTNEKRVILPDTIEGSPVVALGARAFAPHPEPDAPDHRSIRSVTFPATLKKVGDYAFYNCSGLERMHLTDHTQIWGGGCLMNCKKLRTVEIMRVEERSTTPFYFADELSCELDMTIFGPQGVEQRLIFPEYIEEYEPNDPSKQFDFHIYGPGFPYHHAFQNKQLDLSLFDGAWEDTMAREHDPRCTLRLAFFRLLYPKGLSPKSEENFRTYLQKRSTDVVSWLLEERDIDSLSWFLRRFSLEREALSEGLALSRTAKISEATALLLEEQHRRFSTGRSKSFDL